MIAHIDTSQLFPAPGHDHGACIEEVIRNAEMAFQTKGMRMTPLRRRVLKQVASSHRARGAYDVLEDLAKGGERLAPISVYRALDALVEAGVVHKIESLKAYFACHSGSDCTERPMAFICRRCGAVAELTSETVQGEIAAAAHKIGFTSEAPVVEVYGTCCNCADASRSARP